MLPVSEELKRKLEDTNRDLRKAYPRDVFQRDQIRRRLEEIGSFQKVDKWEGERIKEWLQGRSLVGVDGSVNSTPGSHPHTLSVFQALAKGTTGEERWAADLYTPLLDSGDGEAEGGRLAREAKHRGTLLASLELKVASEAVRSWRPRVIMMDGSLLHFLIDDSQGWTRFAEAAEQAGVLLVGVSEEIGTKGLARCLFPDQPTYSDRDVLFGVMRPGEVYRSPEMDPAGTGLWKAVLCSSRGPQPVGVDGLVSQSGDRDALIRLVHSLTPVQGRGIPLWLDIVDKEVRVTDPLVEAMVEQFIDPDLRHRLLVPKRNDRHL
ncbi:DNA double-strand break repair nuclease NurA [Paludifilum halophilum]|uniref:NurA domain-containing protein n=1 Tax=Paludifilum halophilum TaxID=1642702 RepID=A0A235B2B4_9BACL|nr:DNA double-strand break repair nuclease NurA [Paludifilum halophilum]OYD06382.1 hypothetical protein CHM34_16885 [Paludifilum halophilum]